MIPASLGPPLSRLSRLPWREGAAWLLAFSPAIVLAWFIALHAVNIPVWDDWERAELLEKWETGTLTFADLYAPHIDHRMVFPRIITILCNTLGDGDVKWEIAVNYLLGLAAGLGVWRLGRQTLGGQWGPALTFFCNLWIFSPIQLDNWLWPVQTSFLLPMPCLVWALVVAGQASWPWWRRCFVGSLLGIVGTHSFTHGLFVWPAVAGLVLLSPAGSPAAEGRWRFLTSWLAVAAAVVSCYFLWDFKVGSGHSYGQKIGDDTPLMAQWRNALGQSQSMMNFWLATVGGAVGRLIDADPLLSGRRAGGWVLLAYLLASLWVLWHWRDADTRARALPWLALGGAIVAITLGVSVGRSTILASSRAAAPRHVSISLYLPIALLAITFLFLSARPWFAAARWPGLLLAGLAALQVQPWTRGYQLMQVWEASRLQAQARVMFIQHWLPGHPGPLDHRAEGVRKHSVYLNEMGWLERPFVKSLNLKQFSLAERELPKTKGAFESAGPLSGADGWELKGFALFRGPDRPADAVLLAAESPRLDSPKIVGLGEVDGSQLPTHNRIDHQFSVLDEINDADPYSWMRWAKTLRPGDLPQTRPLVVRAWALDVRKRRAYPMAGQLSIDEQGQGRWEE